MLRPPLLHRPIVRRVSTLGFAFCGFWTMCAAALAEEGGPELFGIPGYENGMSSAECQPVVHDGDSTWFPRRFDEVELRQLRSMEPAHPWPVVQQDPYDQPAPAPPAAGTVCGVIIDGSRRYHLETFESTDAARMAGAEVTHTGACGACSSLQDLAVYAGITDLTAPVRECALRGTLGRGGAVLECLEEIGFSEACAAAWYHNVQNTRRECAGICLRSLDAPYNDPDGSLNRCLACDEDESGAVFAAIAGRTRRNSGLPSSICRPADEVVRLTHDYPLDQSVAESSDPQPRP